MSDSKKSSVPEKLMRAAIDVFGKRGYTASRVSDLVAGAGVAQGTFYLYFQNKEAIFLQLVDDFFGRLLGETLGRYPATDLNTPRDLVEQVGRMWRTILGCCREEPVLTTLVLREAYVLGPDSRAQIDARFNHVTAAIGAYLEEVYNAGSLILMRPPRSHGPCSAFLNGQSTMRLSLIPRLISKRLPTCFYAWNWADF